MAAVNQPDSDDELIESEEESDKEDSTKAGDEYTHPQSPSMFDDEEESGNLFFWIPYISIVIYEILQHYLQQFLIQDICLVVIVLLVLILL